jgi:signal transduction histidine kinase
MSKKQVVESSSAEAPAATGALARRRSSTAAFADPIAAPLVAVVGHELRRPLAAALMYLGIARRHLETGLDQDQVRSALATVTGEVERLERLVVRVTELEQYGHAILRPSPMALHRVIHGAIASVFAGDLTARARLKVAVPRSFVGCWDACAVEQIVQNLLSNALKFGEGRPLRLAVSATTEVARISVQDHGIGISPGDRERIFERYVRVSPDRGSGLGLGLWLVKKLAEAHGGRVAVQSRRGHGSTFTVILPQLRAPSSFRARAIPRV